MKTTRLIIAFAIVSVASVGALLTSQLNAKKMAAIAEVVALTGSEIDYTVKGEKNNPRSCTLEVQIEGTGEWKDGFWIEIKYKKDTGIENTCEKGEKEDTCDPYNCHKRV